MDELRWTVVIHDQDGDRIMAAFAIEQHAHDYNEKVIQNRLTSSEVVDSWNE